MIQSFRDRWLRDFYLGDKIRGNWPKRWVSVEKPSMSYVPTGVQSLRTLRYHVEDTALLLRRFAEHLNPGGRIALADLDAEDGSFHEPGTEGVYHQGFERESLAASLRAAGFEQIAFATAHTITKDAGRTYTVFLLTATVGGP